MSQSREFHAPSIEQALDRAAVALKMSPGRLEYEVLDEGSAGLFGIGARDARISVTVEGEDYPEEHFPAEESKDEAAEKDLEESEIAPEAGEEVSEGLLEAAAEFTDSALKRMGIDATTESYESEEAIVVDISSGETGLVIGQKGETIDALQHLTNASIYRNLPFYKRIVLDSEDYRQRRVEAIQGMAHRAARRATREKQDVKLPPMNSQERRIVHVFLKENQDVSSASTGKNENRRVVVSPLKKPE